MVMSWNLEKKNYNKAWPYKGQKAEQMPHEATTIAVLPTIPLSAGAEQYIKVLS